MALNRNKILGEALPPKPTSEGFADVIEAIRLNGDADSFLGNLAAVLTKHGFEQEALRVLRYPSIFCPCDYHHRDVPCGTLGKGGVHE